MSGWFAMKHGISKHHLFKGKPERMAVWVWLVDNAAWKDTPHDVNGETIMVKRGQVAVSQRRIADEVGVGRQVVRTFLDRLCAEGMINPDVTHGKTVVTLCNYEKYQQAAKDEKPAVNPRLTHDQPTKEQVNNIPVGAQLSAAPIDPAKLMFDTGISVLTGAGKSEGAARALLGKWRKESTVESVLDAIGRAQREGAVEPVAFIEGCLRFKSKGPRMANGMTHQEWLREALI